LAVAALMTTSAENAVEEKTNAMHMAKTTLAIFVFRFILSSLSVGGG
jgi:hypothetical protein